VGNFKLKDEDIPPYGPGEHDPEPIDDDLRDRLAWLIKNHRRLAWMYGADNIVLTPEKILLYRSRDREDEDAKDKDGAS